jgi:hypothetical protein
MRFPFISATSQKGEGSLMPFLPILLRHQGHEVSTYGLLDTGASVNVMPFSMGLRLGCIWEQQTIPLKLSGNLALVEARAVFVDAMVEGCTPVSLAFAWTRADNVPVLLGQTNFFMEFDVLFARSARFFEVLPKGSSI